jgi:hypothetical protein
MDTIANIQQLDGRIATAVSKAFKQLLSEKHLYQYVEIDLSFIPEFAQLIFRGYSTVLISSGRVAKRSTFADAIAYCETKVKGTWCPQDIKSETINFQDGREPIKFGLPTINTFCRQCGDGWPFNPVPSSSYFMACPDGNQFSFSAQDEVYLLGYQCQQCKENLVHFLVHREVNKLRLAGRYPLEVLPTPKVLPKGVSEYFGKAMIAHHAGQTLAGLFLLRVFIEQFWRTVHEVQELIKGQPRATGEELGEKYQSTLRTEIRSGFPSLKDIYGKLSEAIHAASDDAKLFDDSCQKIQKHFDARRLYDML